MGMTQGPEGRAAPRFSLRPEGPLRGALAFCGLVKSACRAVFPTVPCMLGLLTPLRCLSHCGSCIDVH